MLPTFLILGAPKCGTTTLHTVLRERNDVFMPSSKDPLFFELDAEFAEGAEGYRRRYFGDWAGETVVGEARPTKLLLPYVPERIRETLPSVRLVAIVRDPVDRFLSHWWMRTCSGKEKLGVEEVFERNLEALRSGRCFEGERGRAEWGRRLENDPEQAPIYLEFGYYAEQLERYLEYFPRENLQVLLYDDLRHRPDALFGDLLGFIGAAQEPPPRAGAVHNAALPAGWRPLIEFDRRIGITNWIPRPWIDALKARLARSGSRPAIDPALVRRIARHYAPHNEKLALLIGRDLSHWRSEGAASPG